MSEKVVRYSLRTGGLFNGNHPVFCPDKNGEWVRASDYATLEAERDRLEAELESVKTKKER